MNILQTKFDNLYILEYKQFSDNRGDFIKTIHAETFEAKGLEYVFPESYFSISKKGVIRGMHFQNPPFDHNKLVYVVSGVILDVVLDIRKGSPTFGETFSIELSSENRKGLYIGKGFAHGFLSLHENSIVEYHTSTSQDKMSEAGIKYDTFGFNWEISNPILSLRDSSLPSFSNLNNSFQ